MRNLVFSCTIFNWQNVNHLTLQDHMYRLNLPICANRNSRLLRLKYFAYFNIVAPFILYAGPYAEQNINYAVYKACYDILFIYAGPHALYIVLSVQLIT